MKALSSFPIIAILGLVLFGMLFLQGQQQTCPLETKMCEDGTYVAKNLQSCAFDPCPGLKAVDYASLVNSLRLEATVQLLGPVSLPNISLEGQLIKINNEEVQLYEFANSKEAYIFDISVRPDGSRIGNILVSGNSHFYRYDRMIAIYFGNDPQVEKVLESVMGKEFAGSAQTQHMCNHQAAGEVCMQIYSPVCGWADPTRIQCIRYPCATTYSNSCNACNDINVQYWTEGECPK
jgi:hypothetical protein